MTFPGGWRCSFLCVLVQVGSRSTPWTVRLPSVDRFWQPAACRPSAFTDECVRRGRQAFSDV
nr:MAG TPA: hypothetical protein [Caudoviricetes sp.]